MTYRAEVFVTLKPVVNDPAGLTIKGGLHALGFESVSSVRAGKYLVVTLDADDEGEARSRVEEMARQLLANAVIEDYRIELQPAADPIAAAPSPSPDGEVQALESPSPAGGAGQELKSPSPARGGGQGGGA
jgi:phosphoribosylformylglycinamidine synthase